MTIQHSDPKAVASWSEDLPDSFLMCRDMGHTWRPYRAKFNPEENGYDRVLRCGRCKTERQQTISMSGMILTGHYSYPEGYQAPPGTGRIDGEGRGAMRLESTLRLISKDER
jgi:hypothetical protein